jgi:hypothetical protein
VSPIVHDKDDRVRLLRRQCSSRTCRLWICELLPYSKLTTAAGTIETRARPSRPVAGFVHLSDPLMIGPSAISAAPSRRRTTGVRGVIARMGPPFGGELRPIRSHRRERRRRPARARTSEVRQAGSMTFKSSFARSRQIRRRHQRPRSFGERAAGKGAGSTFGTGDELKRGRRPRPFVASRW